MFVSTHYAGKEVTMSFQGGEPYKKVFGPVFAYINSVSSENDTLSLWSDAVQKVPLTPNSTKLRLFIKHTKVLMLWHIS